MLYIGVDPGAKGYLCLLEKTDSPIFVSLDPKKHTADTIVNALQTEIDGRPALAAIEDVHSIYGMSAKSNFMFGGMVWRARTILECCGLEYDMVQPKVWQKATGIPARKDLPDGTDLKTAVADIAQQLYPAAVLHGPKGGLLDGRSDALMIAHYLKLQFGGWHALQANNAGSTSLVPEKPGTE